MEQPDEAASPLPREPPSFPSLDSFAFGSSARPMCCLPILRHLFPSLTCSSKTLRLQLLLFSIFPRLLLPSEKNALWVCHHPIPPDHRWEPSACLLGCFMTSCNPRGPAGQTDPDFPACQVRDRCQQQPCQESAGQADKHDGKVWGLVSEPLRVPPPRLRVCEAPPTPAFPMDEQLAAAGHRDGHGVLAGPQVASLWLILMPASCLDLLPSCVP